jgi:hypothetical protein
MSRVATVFKFVLLDFVITEQEMQELQNLPEQLRNTP